MEKGGNMSNFFDKQKELAEKSGHRYWTKYNFSGKDAEYIVFCVNNMARVCDLLERAISTLREQCLGGAVEECLCDLCNPRKEIQSALEEMGK